MGKGAQDRFMVGFRVPQRDVARLNALLERLRREGLGVRRVEVATHVVVRGLEIVESMTPAEQEALFRALAGRPIR